MYVCVYVLVCVYVCVYVLFVLVLGCMVEEGGLQNGDVIMCK